MEWKFDCIYFVFLDTFSWFNCDYVAHLSILHFFHTQESGQTFQFLIEKKNEERWRFVNGLFHVFEFESEVYFRTRNGSFLCKSRIRFEVLQTDYLSLKSDWARKNPTLNDIHTKIYPDCPTIAHQHRQIGLSINCESPLVDWQHNSSFGTKHFPMSSKATQRQCVYTAQVAFQLKILCVPPLRNCFDFDKS